MVSRWAWSILWSVGFAAAVACSGSSNGSGGPDDAGGSGAEDAGSGGSGGASGKGGKGGSAGSTTGKGGSGGTSDPTGGVAGEPSEGGVGNVSPVGGSAGTVFAGSAGVGGIAGTAGTAGIAGTAGAGGMNPTVPSGWTCTVIAYQDGVCDCGCGAQDADCENHDDVAACGRCNASGSCNTGECPGKINLSETTSCEPPPLEWACADSRYEDGASCDCGCGVVDPDCESADVEACEVCNWNGSCAGGPCPGSVNPTNNATCDIPEDWACELYDYKDGICHCGCGALDADCSSSASSACEVCWTGCSSESCPGPIDAEDNSICTGPPLSWNCDVAFYGDGSQCHCGCGAIDPDCESTELAACERCNFPGSCSARACPGTIDPEDIANCVHPEPPDTWICPEYSYADGFQCDCGCGALDLDCATNEIRQCDYCTGCAGGSCPGRIDPSDIAVCTPVPPGWICDENQYGDGYACNCGCGVVDPDCEDALVSSCEYCWTSIGGCTDDCADIVPDDNSRCFDSPPVSWTCPTVYYGDQVCDCGCGAVDVDCPSAAGSACTFCDAQGGCAAGNCDLIDPVNNAVCSAD